ncbi:hypothetical protein COCOBI_07-4150 [Coccomyxa sp. Obi]|nr:hypothetical protein COCOBI_07-4150 [Coccomyxa sp. Obi]
MNDASSSVQQTNDEEASQGSVEMYIASADLPLPLKLQTMPMLDSRQRLRVAPPRNQRAVAQQDDEAAPALQQSMRTDASRALRKELGVTKANLQSKTAELSQATRALKGKDKEIALLRAALVERDGRLQAGRAELLQARMELQEKDEELVTAYQRLTEACQQRSAVRAALIGTQTELAATSAELDAWTHEIATFQTELAEMADEDPLIGTQNGANRGDAKFSSGTPPKASASTGLEDRDVSSMLELLQNLSQLSTELQKDAEEDDEIFREGGSD